MDSTHAVAASFRVPGKVDPKHPDQKPSDRVNRAFYPSLYQRTSDVAVASQKWYKRAIAFEVVLTVIGGLAVVATQIPSLSQPFNNLLSVRMFGATVVLLSVTTAVALLVTAVTIGVRYWWRPGERWRESRFIGETAISLAWRYGVKATGFDLGTGPAKYRNAQTWYTEQIKYLLEKTSKLNLGDKGSSGEITPLMTSERDVRLKQRFADYRDLRAQDQVNWYSNKVKIFTGTRNLWRTLLVATYAVGGLILLAHATGLRTAAPFGLLDANYWPLVVAVTGSIATWVAAQHYEDLVQSYTSVRDRLQLEIDGMQGFTTDPEFAEDAAHEAIFAQWVDHVELLMDAEHQQWHAMA